MTTTSTENTQNPKNRDYTTFCERDGLTGIARIVERGCALFVEVTYDAWTCEVPKSFPYSLALEDGLVGSLFGDNEHSACAVCGRVHPNEQMYGGVCGVCVADAQAEQQEAAERELTSTIVWRQEQFQQSQVDPVPTNIRRDIELNYGG